MLRAIGFRSVQITPYHRGGQAQHVLVEVVTAIGKVIMDPLYGFYYVNKNGLPMGLEDLRAGNKPYFVPFPRSNVSAYPEDDFYAFNYTEAKTAKWTHGRFRFSVYLTLRQLTSGKIDLVRQPWWMEWPQLVICIWIVCFMVGLNLVFAI